MHCAPTIGWVLLLLSQALTCCCFLLMHFVPKLEHPIGTIVQRPYANTDLLLADQLQVSSKQRRPQVTMLCVHQKHPLLSDRMQSSGSITNCSYTRTRPKPITLLPPSNTQLGYTLAVQAYWYKLLYKAQAAAACWSAATIGPNNRHCRQSHKHPLHPLLLLLCLGSSLLVPCACKGLL